MKNLVIIILVVMSSTTLFAQEKQKEVGAVFNDFNSFGITYRTGNTNGMWRFTSLAALSSSNNMKADSASRDGSDLLVSLAIGREFRKSIGSQLEFRYGLDVRYAYKSSEFKSQGYNYSWSYDNNGQLNSPTVVESRSENMEVTNSVGVQLVLGINYVVKEKLVFGLEINPAFMFTSGERTEKAYSSENEIQDYLNVNTYNANYKQTYDISRYDWGFNSGIGQVSILYRF
ncbi:hypothetical protein [Flammeovirga aprica]|uniref:Outer membrane protein beta-barrel domain-containing protein n=1 Tax=Flammeovirga aprica JL-4 TaxID=694437 RepID=A0A7X9S0D4_9BACT|nr:hypothetical protein [Flammeovirga aprica]NME72093.1 hypothetical protein [Flammeovirga aprica JL-4]